jgi:DNA recombination protein RmuC
MDTYFAGFAGMAALAGILVGFWLRGLDVRAMIASLEQRNREIAEALAKARGELEHNTADTAARAAFESVATEREKVIVQMTAEQERMRGELQAKTDAEAAHAARVSELEADLRDERQKTEGLSGETTEKKSNGLSSRNEGELDNWLSPIRQQLNEFREKLEQAQLDSNSGVTKLEALIGTLGGMNQQLARETRNLSTALRGSSRPSGDWGKVILRDLLVKAGLRDGNEFSVQESFSNLAIEDGGSRENKQKDVIVQLPAGRHLVIDSKVPLNAFADSVNAELEEDRLAATKEHLNCVRSHVSSVAHANYHGLPGVLLPDFVMVFVPIEPAFLAALQGDPDLWADAYAKGILLVGPTTLLYVMRIVSVLWRQEDQNRAVKEVMDHGASLYSEFAAFINDMESMSESLRSASARYDEAKEKLSDGRDNLINQFERLKLLGAESRPLKLAQPIPFKLFAAENGNGGLSHTSEVEGEALKLAAETAETNGYDHERAQELQLEESPYSVS